MLISYKRGQTSVVLRVKIYDSSVTTGAGKTGLAYNTSGLKIATIADNEASTTVYTVAGSTIEDITTLGTFATPTATKCRFKEVDATNHPGVYEIHIANARFAVTSAKSLMVSISGATNAAECDVLIPLVDFDPYGASTSNISFAAGITITQSTTNGVGLSITGNGSGTGVAVTGGATGSAMTLTGGGTSGTGITVTTTSGNGITVTSGGGNGTAVALTGNGSGNGITATGGTTGHGMSVAGGGSGGRGLNVAATVGDGVAIIGGASGDGVQITGVGSQSALNLIAGSTGNGITITGGSTSGKGIYITTTNGTGIDVTTTAGYGTYISSGSTVGSLFTGATNAIQVLGTSGAAITVTGGSNGAAIALAGTGTGAGLSATGGATGAGLVVTGGGTSGNGITVTTTNGHGFSINAAGASKDGFIIVGAQYDINADIQGSVSGVTSLDAAGVRAAIGLASANLDTQLTAIDDYLDTEIAAIKAKTDNLPATPASSSDCLTAADVRTAVGLASANLDTQLAPLGTGVTLATPVGLKKNIAVTAFTFSMVDSTDHITPTAGLTVTAQRSIDGGALASCANSVSEIGNGIYKINLATTDMNGDVITLRFTATGADPRIITIFTEE